MNATVLTKIGIGMPRQRRNTAAEWRGRMEERLDNLIEAFESERDRAESQRTAALEGINILSNNVRELTNEVQGMKPAVAEFKEIRAEGRGIGRLLRAIVIFAAWAGTIIVALITGHHVSGTPTK
jgi:hypothetical protein